jgi:prolyl-tRNA editing enzyme YbaK/EbsC (Cys-tRNA(Pro) deacylase)
LSARFGWAEAGETRFAEQVLELTYTLGGVCPLGLPALPVLVDESPKLRWWAAGGSSNAIFASAGGSWGLHQAPLRIAT